MFVIVKFQVHDSRSPCQVILVSNVKLTCIGRPGASVVIGVASSSVVSVVSVGLVAIIVVSSIVIIVVANPSANVATFSCRSFLIIKPITFVNLVIAQTMPC